MEKFQTKPKNLKANISNYGCVNDLDQDYSPKITTTYNPPNPPSWYPPESFGEDRDNGIFLVDKITIARQKQTTRQFSLKPMDEDEFMALSAWDDDNSSNLVVTNSERNEAQYMNENSFSKNSSDTTNIANNVDVYDDDTASMASMSTCSTATTSDLYPSVMHVTLNDLINFKKRRDSMQNNINNYNKSIDTTSVINKGKQRIVNFKDEIVESPGESSKKLMEMESSALSIISNDSSTIKDNNSSHKEVISEISITIPLNYPKISTEEQEAIKIDKQNKLRAWVKCLWPQPRLPGSRQLSFGLNPRSLSKRNLNPSIVGIVVMQKSVPMILTAILKGTKHPKKEIDRNGQIKFTGEPVIIKGVYDPREYLLLHCPTYQNPPCYNGNPKNPWTEHFLLNKILPRLSSEAIKVQNEVGLFLTVRESLLWGLEHSPIFQCRTCTNVQHSFSRKFNYKGVREHLFSSKHAVSYINEEEMIRVNPKDFMMAFYRNLPPMIVTES
ncbi:871_t:CDS:1 [Funneliformis geosporum]|nr:871_t:CDS:1 [Funneliformis geosporum]